MNIISAVARGIARAIGRALTTALALVLALGVGVAVATNYQMTQGTGSTFASAVISAVNYMQILLCDATAGTTQCAAVSASGAVKVDGSAATQPVSGTVTANAGTGNFTVVNGGTFATQAAQSGTWNITNVSGTISLPTGAATAANQGLLTTWAGGTLGAMANYGTSPGAVPVPGVNAFITNANANGQALKANSSPVTLASDQSVADPCMFQAKSNAAISTASGTTAIVTGVSAKKIYVCSLSLIIPTAVSVSLAEGSSSTCGTSNQAAVIGVATSGTAANGMAFAANGGLTLGNGNGTVALTATAANYLCLFQSGTAQIAGNLTYVQQ